MNLEIPKSEFPRKSAPVEVELPYSEDAVRTLLRFFAQKTRSGGERKQKEIIDAPKIKGSITAPQLSQYLQSPELGAKKINAKLYSDLLDLAKSENWNFLGTHDRTKITNVLDHLYHSMEAHFNVWGETRADVIRKLPGYYWSYRPSVRTPGAITRGLVRIAHILETDAIVTSERHVASRHRRSQHAIQVWEGYVWRREMIYHWIDVDVETSVQRKTLMSANFIHNGKIQELTGRTQGTWGRKIISSKVFLERTNDLNYIDLPKRRSREEQLTVENMEKRKDFFRKLRVVVKKNDIIYPDKFNEEVPPTALKEIHPDEPGSIIIE